MGPLQGIRVIDLSLHLAGPYASTLLGDMGAEVIRVERIGGDDDRRLGSSIVDEDSYIFISRARNKKSLTLNLRTPEGHGILERLIKVSDVLLENYGPATKKALDLDYEQLKQVNPRLIMASVSAYGSWGPSKDKVAFDPIAQAACGAMSFNGFPENEMPVRASVAWVDYSTALHAAMGIMFALWHREKTGKGQHIDVSLYDTALELVGAQGVYTDYIRDGVERQKMGNCSAYAYADTFRTKDGWVFIHLGRDANWRRFCQLIGREELISDPRFNSDANRAMNRKLIDEIVKPWVAERTCEEVSRLVTGVRIPNQKICSIPEVLDDPQLQAREMLVDVDYPGKGKVPIPGIVIKLSETPGEIKCRSPLIGEHNEQILVELLGYTKEEVSGLVEKKIV